jgi:Skp family chaperone for outer membrane proteins
MKKCALILFISLFSLLLNAAPAAMPKIGYVNFEVAFAQENEAQKHTADLEKEERAILEREQKARGDIETKMAKFQESMAKLSDKARQEQQMALGEEINKLQEQLNQKRVEHGQKRQHILGDLENKNRLLLESISRKESYDLVFNSAALVYASDEIKKNDITGKLVAEYNKAYPVKAEPAKAAPQKGAPVKKPAAKAAPAQEKKAIAPNN